MNIYLAASWPRRYQMRVRAVLLRGLGHTVTSRWHDGDAQRASEEELLGDDQTLAIRLASQNWDDLERADLVICFTDPPGSSLSQGGRHVEYGLAQAIGKPCWIVGPPENIYHALADRVFPAWPEALAALGEERGE